MSHGADSTWLGLASLVQALGMLPQGSGTPQEDPKATLLLAAQDGVCLPLHCSSAACDFAFEVSSAQGVSSSYPQISDALSGAVSVREPWGKGIHQKDGLKD